MCSRIAQGLQWWLVACSVGTVLATPLFAQDTEQEVRMSLTVTSSAFQPGGTIPSLYTCDDKNISPPLSWTDPPEGTKSFALISDDPDAPMGTWVHWVLYNLPASARKLAEALPADAQLPDGTRQGTTDFGRTGYGGPCPPSGTHRYFFRLSALDSVLALEPGATTRELEAAMPGHILAQAELMGTYKRRGR